MCEFCVQHGDGQKWYLAMQNYSRELLDEDGRLDYIAHFANTFEERLPPALDQLDLLSRTPLHGPAKPFLTRNQKQDHFGQVVPVEEVEQILQQVDGIARLPCVCRRVTTGQKEARYCFALTGDPRLAEVLDDSFSLEYLSPAEAVESVRENVAGVDLDACNGCRNCMRQCQFGAIRYSMVNAKVEIDPRQCFGCGVCRAACHRDAITLHARADDPVAAEVW